MLKAFQEHSNSIPIAASSTPVALHTTAMGKVVVELVVNVVPDGTWLEQQGHSRGKWNLKVKDGMTPTMAMEKLRKCSKFKANYTNSKQQNIKTPKQETQRPNSLTASMGMW